MDNHNNDEWGNIPLPGITDEELFGKNSNVLIMNRYLNKKRIGDSNWSDQQKKAAVKRYAKPGERERVSKIARQTMLTNKNFLRAKEQAREYSKKRIVTPYGIFESFNETQRNIIGIDLSKKIKELPHLYYYECVGPGQPTYEKVYNTPYGRSNKRSDVYKFAQLANEPNALKLKHKANWWNKMLKLNPIEYYITNDIAIDWSLLGIYRNTNKRKT